MNKHLRADFGVGRKAKAIAACTTCATAVSSGAGLAQIPGSDGSEFAESADCNCSCQTAEASSCEVPKLISPVPKCSKHANTVTVQRHRHSYKLSRSAPSTLAWHSCANEREHKKRKKTACAMRSAPRCSYKSTGHDHGAATKCDPCGCAM